MWCANLMLGDRLELEAIEGCGGNNLVQVVSICCTGNDPARSSSFVPTWLVTA